jgi:hypothetical protein
MGITMEDYGGIGRNDYFLTAQNDVYMDYISLLSQNSWIICQLSLVRCLVTRLNRLIK